MTGIDYITQIGKSLGILPAANESHSDYSQRVLLSAVSAWMQTAVYFDVSQTSVERIHAVGLSKTKLFQNIDESLTIIDAKETVDYIYAVLAGNGAYFHTPYNVRPIPHTLAGHNGIAIVRGMKPEEKVNFSGLAPFIASEQSDNISETFHLLDMPEEDVIRMVWNHCTPTDDSPEEYLDVFRSGRGRYYTTKQPRTDKIIMGRSGYNTEHISYYVIAGQERRRMPDEYADASIRTYFQLAVMNQHSRQRIRIYRDPNLVKLEFEYRLPEPDLRFLQYIAWPKDLTKVKDDVWNYSIKPEMWALIKDRYEQKLNYVMEEQTNE